VSTRKRIYVDHGLTGTNRARPGLRQALAACRAGDTLAVAKLDRLARSVPDARDIVDELTGRGVRLNLGGSVHDPTDPVGRLLFNVLAMVAEFEADLARARTREGMAVARAKDRLRGKRPKLNPRQEAHLVSGGAPVGTPPSSWPSCSTSPAPRSTAPSNAPARRRKPPPSAVGRRPDHRTLDPANRAERGGSSPTRPVGGAREPLLLPRATGVLAGCRVR